MTITDPNPDPQNTPLTVQGVPVTPGAPQPRLYTEEELLAQLEKTRKEEHKKLYPQVEEAKKAAAEAQAKLEAEEAAKAAATADIQRKQAEAEDAKRREELSAKDLLAEQEKRWEARLEAERAEREKAFALLAREQEYSALRDYRVRAWAANQDKILPELESWLTGPRGETLESIQEIDTYVAELIEMSSSVMGNVASAQNDAKRGSQTVGTRSTPPGYDPNSDPSVTGQGTDEISAEDLRNMPVREYAQNFRHRLPTGRSGTSSKGLYD